MLPGLGRLLQGPASAGLLLMLLALPPAAPSCPMLCTCYSSPPTVSCQANNFSSVPLSLPPSTQRLFLQNNLIRTLRPGTFGPSLLTLWLFSNNLSTIYPGTFRHLQALEELDLGDNRHLRSLEPDTFQGLERLQSLHLYRCQLSSLPGNIFRGLVSLQYLYLQENSLLHLQEAITHPPNHSGRNSSLGYIASGWKGGKDIQILPSPHISLEGSCSSPGRCLPGLTSVPI
uniref:Reticulon 4 receptor like 2 n=1 Tax=Felis catus TaxID=9685 RepID=A0ABI7Z8K6_FELCA